MNMLMVIGYVVVLALVVYLVVDSQFRTRELGVQISELRAEMNRKNAVTAAFMNGLATHLKVHWEAQPAKEAQYVVVNNDNGLPHWRKVTVNEVLTKT